MARMLGVSQRDWCPICRTGCGRDCPSTARSKGAARVAERRDWRREVAAGEFAPFADDALELADLTYPAAAEAWSGVAW